MISYKDHTLSLPVRHSCSLLLAKIHQKRRPILILPVADHPAAASIG